MTRYPLDRRKAASLSISSAIKPAILLVSTADWSNPFWTNKQHVAVELARLGHNVFYVESQGLRRPTATKRDLMRIWRRLRRGLNTPRRVAERIWVFSPVVIPFQGSPKVRVLNRWLLNVSLRFWTWRLGVKPSLLWTYSPMTTELFDMSVFDLVVYHAVDDVKEQPGIPRDVVAAAEIELSRRADLIFTTAPYLQSMHSRLNPNTHLFSNVADFAHFNKALAADLAIPDDLARIPGPRVGFVGAISSYKLDFLLIRDVVLRRPDWSFVFIGDVGEGDPMTDPSILEGLPNLHLLGPRSYDKLPAYLKGIDVAILPNRLNDYTRSMFPMKFYEFLAAGRPIVATRLAALQDQQDLLYFADNAEEFVAKIACALTQDGLDLDKRLAAARVQTYEIRTAKMMELVVQALASRATSCPNNYGL